MSDDDLKQCSKCEVYTSRIESHICVEYDGPPCKTCGEPTVFVEVAAPGTGRGWSCKGKGGDHHFHGVNEFIELDPANQAIFDAMMSDDFDDGCPYDDGPDRTDPGWRERELAAAAEREADEQLPGDADLDFDDPSVTVIDGGTYRG